MTRNDTIGAWSDHFLPCSQRPKYLVSVSKLMIPQKPHFLQRIIFVRTDVDVAAYLGFLIESAFDRCLYCRIIPFTGLISSVFVRDLDNN